MNKRDCDNLMARQARLSPEFVKIMSDSMSYDKMLGALTMKEIWDAQKVIITGCGDSWLCGIAAKPVFEKIAKMDVECMRNVEFTRYYNKKNLGYSPNTPLVFGVSISGTVSRAIEAMERATHHKAMSVAITNNPESPIAKAARRVIPLDMPVADENGKPYEYNPGVNSYIASTMALMKTAIRIARVKNKISMREEVDIIKSMHDWVDEYCKIINDIDDRCFELAKTWKDLRAVDFIGDYADYATAFFGSAKVIEAYGGYTTYDDSEDWCHINYFLRDPETIGRVVVANSETESFNRLKETMVAIEQLKSPTIVITDAPKSEFPESFEVFSLPKPKYFWMNPLLQHIPFDFIPGYIAELKGVAHFRRDLPEIFDKPRLDGIENRIKASKIEII